MSEIPPDISSAAQSGIQAHEVAKERGARSAGQVNAAARQVKTVDEAGSTVETTDNDVAIFSDAEGAGSQGRESEETPPEDEASGDDKSTGGIVQGDDGKLHIDLEA